SLSRGSDRQGARGQEVRTPQERRANAAGPTDLTNPSDKEAARMSNALKYTAIGGLIAATLDIVYAFVFFGFRGVSAITILQSVASGVLGNESYRRGVLAALLGLVLHYFIMFIIACVFLVVATRLDVLVRRPILCGALFGVIVYCVMNFVVLPLSASPG